MSISNLLSGNIKSWQNLNVESISSDKPIKLPIQDQFGLTLSQGVTIATEGSAGKLIFSTVPEFMSLDPLSFNITNSNILPSSIVIPQFVVGAFPNTFLFLVKTDSIIAGQATFQITYFGTTNLTPSSLEIHYTIINAS